MTLRLSTGLVNELGATGSLKATMEGGAGFVIDIYSGNRPATPDAAATGVKLCTISNNAAGTGIHFEGDAPVGGAVVKETTETWKGTVLADGTAGYYRMRRTTDAGVALSTTERRIDGAIATSGGDLNLTSLSLVTGAPVEISSFAINIPQTE
jgi:hypothetical protein